MYYIVYDTETTGLEKYQALLSKPCSITKIGSEVIQIGGLFLDERMLPVRGFCHYCDCIAAHSSKAAYDVHGIDVEDIRNGLNGIFLEEVMAYHLPEFFDSNVLFIGYNTVFDLSMVAQSVRDFSVHFGPPKQVVGRLPSRGRHYVDVMSYLGPHRMKLTQAKKLVEAEYDEFVSLYEKALVIDSNRPDLFQESWVHSHNSLYDALITYLLYLKKVWNTGILGGVRVGN